MRDFKAQLIPAFLVFLFLCESGCAQITTSASPIGVKVVVVTMFERGEDTGDTPGEYQLWVEREHLDQVIPLLAGYHHVRMNKDGVLGMVTGVGTAKAAASIMALGLDPRFDLSKAYWNAERVHRSTKKSVKHPGRQELPANLPRIERVLPCTPDQRVCKRCGQETVVIGYEESSQLDVEPSKYFGLVTKREKRACRSCVVLFV